MSPPDYDANLVPAPSLTREFEAIPGYHQPKSGRRSKRAILRLLKKLLKIYHLQISDAYLSRQKKISLSGQIREGQTCKGALERWLVRSPRLIPKRVQVPNLMPHIATHASKSQTCLESAAGSVLSTWILCAMMPC